MFSCICAASREGDFPSVYKKGRARLQITLYMHAPATDKGHALSKWQQRQLGWVRYRSLQFLFR